MSWGSPLPALHALEPMPYREEMIMSRVLSILGKRPALGDYVLALVIS